MMHCLIDGEVSSLEVYKRYFDPSATSGHFTSFRVQFAAGKLLPTGWDLHYARLMRDAYFLGTSVLSQEFLARLVVETLTSSKLSGTDVRVRLDFARDRVGLCAQALQPFGFGEPSALSLQTVDMQRPAAEYKLYVGELVSRQAQLQLNSGFDEALLVDKSGSILEGAWSNFGWIDPCGVVYVTGLGLNGVTQQLLPRTVERVTGLTFGGSRNLLLDSLELVGSAPFIVSSVRGIIAVRAINQQHFKSQQPELNALASALRERHDG